VSDAAQLQLAYIDRKNVTFELHVDENLPTTLIGDILRVNQIISHLLTNAFKYTNEGSVSLTLACERGEGERVNLIITIADTGIGMSKSRIKEIEDLNSEFVNLNEQAKNYQSGTGLGLPVVYSLVNMMGAKMTFQSELNEGSTVVVNIPQRTTTFDILGVEVAQSLEKLESVTWNSSKEFQFEPPQMPHGKVLVVDDVDSNLYVAEAMLESFGITVELCESAEDALAKIEAGNIYHIILMDHMMPNMDGIEATKILRERGYNHPIVALTAGSGQSQAQMFTENGFSGFMSKPIDIYLLNAYLVRNEKEKGRH
jgi:CheY-like chemotaxis protein/anti-sigma regulatory factor (Ser/Thr protein kinase)